MRRTIAFAFIAILAISVAKAEDCGGQPCRPYSITMPDGTVIDHTKEKPAGAELPPSPNQLSAEEAAQTVQPAQVVVILCIEGPST